MHQSARVGDLFLRFGSRFVEGDGVTNRSHGILIAYCLLGLLWGAETPAAPANDPQTSRPSRPLSFSQVRLGGELGARYMAAACNLLTRTDRYTLDSFAANAAGKPGCLWPDWPADQFGRWFSVLHVAEGYGWTPAVEHRQAVAGRILALQTKEGNFGPPGSAERMDSRIPSGNGFALRGLTEAYADTRDPRFLDAARKLARYFEAIAPRWETRQQGKLHEYYGHCLDGLVALFEQGGDRWALELAERLAQHAGRTEHTHHSLSLCRGLCDLARVTGKKEYLAKAEDYLVWCREHQIVTGGLPEGMPQSEQDEGCGLADWIVVNLMMYAQTGEERYLDAAEHTLVNHFFMNQFHTGGFGHRSFSPEVIGGKQWQGWNGQFGSENPGCCSLWGQWALGQVGRFVVTQSDSAVWVNLYPAAEIALPERGLRLEISADFPRLTRAQIRLQSEKPQFFSLALRIPPWARAMKVKCDGLEVEHPDGGRRVLISRTWKTSTTIDIELVTGLRVVSWPAKEPKGVAVFDGPLCLGLSSEVADVTLPWAVLVDGANQPIPDGGGRAQVAEASGRTLKTLEPIGARWLTPEVKNPARKRVLFQTQPGTPKAPRTEPRQ